MTEDKTFRLLEAADWKSIIAKLTWYAIWKARRYRWKSGDPRNLPEGNTPEDLALDAVEKVLTGTREWDSDKYPNLLKHLKWIVDSDLSHLLESERIPSSELLIGHEMAPGTTINDPHLRPEEARSEDPETLLIARQDQAHEEEVKRWFYDMVRGDEGLEDLLLCFDEGINKAEAISEQLGIEVSEVYNLKRRLRRKADKFNEILIKSSD